MSDEIGAESPQLDPYVGAEPVAAVDKPVPNPAPYDTMIIRVDIELGPERIRATETVDGYGPDMNTWEKVEAFRAAFMSAARDLWTASEDAGWGKR